MNLRRSPLFVSGPVVLALVLGAAFPLAAQESKGSHSVGISASDEVSERDLGLPLYPGAHRYKDSSDESSAAKLGLWGSDSGFQLVVLKLETDDPAERVAAFYRKALAKYGRVLDCSEKASHTRKSKDELTCDSDEPKPGEMVYKSGTREKQHAVGIQSSGGHTRFELVYLEQRGEDADK